MLGIRWLAAVLMFSPALGSAVTISNTDLGEVNQFEQRRAEIVIHNPSADPVRIVSIEPSRAGDKVVASSTSAELKGGESRAVQLDVVATNDLGYATHSFVIATNEPKSNSYVAHVRLFALSILDEPRLQVDFGAIKADDKTEPKTMTIASSEDTGLRIKRILEVPEFVHAQISGDGRSVELQVDSKKHWGSRSGNVKLALSSSVQTQAWIDVKANVVGEVAAIADPYNLGVVRTGQAHDFVLQVSSVHKKPFTIQSLKLDGFKAKLGSKPCASGDATCKLVELHLDADVPPGFLRGVISAELPEFGVTLPIHVGGLVVRADAKIEPLDKHINEDGEKAHSTAAANENLATALKKVVQGPDKPNEDAVPAGSGPLLKWTVGNGQVLYGFQIFRGDNENGPFARIDKETIKASTDGDDVKYQYRDNTAVSGKTYWYYIGTVYNDGHKQQLTGPQKVVAK
jgi:hypothetical protein